MYSKQFWFFYLVILLFVISVSCGKSEQNKPVRIAYLPITHALLLCATDKTFKNNSNGLKIELIRFGSWPELLDALNSGRVDGASVLIEMAIKAKSTGIGIKAVALGHRNGNVVVISNRISSGKHLQGKTFAIPHRLSSHNILLELLLKKNGLTRESLNIIELAPPEMPAALAEGRIDGYCVAEPFGAKSVTIGKGKVLYKSEDLWPNSLCCSLVLRDDFIKMRNNEAKIVVKEYIKSGYHLDKDITYTKNIAKQYLKVEPKVIDLSLQWISFNDLLIKQKDYNILIGYMRQLKLIDSPPKYDEFIDESLLQ